MGSQYHDPDRNDTPAVFHFQDKLDELSDGTLTRARRTGRSGCHLPLLTGTQAT